MQHFSCLQNVVWKMKVGTSCTVLIYVGKVSINVCTITTVSFLPFFCCLKAWATMSQWDLGVGSA